MPETKAMPRLSETLSPIAWPHRCQRCQSYSVLVVWQEHDESDRPEQAFVLLCARCSGAVIEPHPRLYRRLGIHEPAPGVMEICEGCARQDEGRCRSPRLLANGGPGLAFPGPDTRVHILYAGKKGRKCGAWSGMWDAEPSSCEGFEPAGKEVRHVEP